MCRALRAPRRYQKAEYSNKGTRTGAQGRGHHLVDPDQWHDLFFTYRGVAAIRLYAVKLRARTENAPSVFIVDSDGSLSDPHQSPFWIKTLGLLPWGVGTRPLAPRSPRKSSALCTCPSASGASLSAPPGGRHRLQGSVVTDIRNWVRPALMQLRKLEPKPYEKSFHISGKNVTLRRWVQEIRFFTASMNLSA